MTATVVYRDLVEFYDSGAEWGLVGVRKEPFYRSTVEGTDEPVVCPAKGGACYTESQMTQPRTRKVIVEQAERERERRTPEGTERIITRALEANGGWMNQREIRNATGLPETRVVNFTLSMALEGKIRRTLTEDKHTQLFAAFVRHDEVEGGHREQGDHF